MLYISYIQNFIGDKLIMFGNIVALVTPFLQNSSIDYEALRKILNFHINSRVDGLLVAGTTGEGHLLSLEEKQELLSFVVSNTKHIVPIIFGATGMTVNEVKEHIFIAESLQVSGVLVSPPPYISLDQNSIYYFYKEVAAGSSIPIIIYNNPVRSGTSINANTVLELAKIKNIFGIKDCSGDDMFCLTLTKNLSSKHFRVFAGNDSDILKYLAYGASGYISAAANVYPAVFKSIYSKYKSNYVSTASSDFYKLLPLCNLLAKHKSPLAIKFLLSKVVSGLNTGYSRDPIKPISKALEAELMNVLKKNAL